MLILHNINPHLYKRPFTYSVRYYTLFRTFELEPCLLNGSANVGLVSGACYNEGIGRRGGLAGVDAFHFADSLFTGGFAMIAVHTFNGIDNRPGNNFLFLEFTEEFHSKGYYDEQY